MNEPKEFRIVFVFGANSNPELWFAPWFPIGFDYTDEYLIGQFDNAASNYGSPIWDVETR